MLKTYEYRLYPTKEQEVLLAKHFGCVRLVYNKALALKKKLWEEKKLRIEDALNATKAAVKEGIVAGGGTALLKASKEVEKLLKGEKMKKDVRTGVDIVLKALSAPIMQIAENAGEAGAVIADKVSSNKNSNFGYDALEGRFVDMIEQGIIDPVKVTKSALTNAASVASMILTSEAAVIELPKKEGLQLNTDVGSMYL